MKVIKIFNGLDKLVEKVSAISLVIAVVLMLLFTLLNIVGRWFGVMILWVDPLVRHLVFLSTFLGGVIATGRGTHVGIDIVSIYLEKKGLNHIKKIVGQVVFSISLATLIWLIYASILFFQVELKYGRVQFLGIHSGALVFIIPLGFSLIAYRFLNKLLLSFTSTKEESC